MNPPYSIMELEGAAQISPDNSKTWESSGTSKFVEEGNGEPDGHVDAKEELLEADVRVASPVDKPAEDAQFPGQLMVESTRGNQTQSFGNVDSLVY